MKTYTIEFYKTDNRRNRVAVKISEDLFQKISTDQYNCDTILKWLIWSYIKDILKEKTSQEKKFEQEMEIGKKFLRK